MTLRIYGDEAKRLAERLNLTTNGNQCPAPCIIRRDSVEGRIVIIVEVLA